MSLLTWTVRKSPPVNFLPGDRRAEWIVFPTAVDPRGHALANVDASFRREFVLSDGAPTATLSIRVMRRAEIKINACAAASRA